MPCEGFWDIFSDFVAHPKDATTVQPDEDIVFIGIKYPHEPSTPDPTRLECTPGEFELARELMQIPTEVRLSAASDYIANHVVGVAHKAQSSHGRTGKKTAYFLNLVASVCNANGWAYTFLVALVYLDRALARMRMMDRDWSPERIFVGSMVLADKYCGEGRVDISLLSRKVFMGMPTSEIGQCEWDIFEALEFSNGRIEVRDLLTHRALLDHSRTRLPTAGAVPPVSKALRWPPNLRQTSISQPLRTPRACQQTDTLQALEPSATLHPSTPAESPLVLTPGDLWSPTNPPPTCSHTHSLAWSTQWDYHACSKPARSANRSVSPVRRAPHCAAQRTHLEPYNRQWVDRDRHVQDLVRRGEWRDNRSHHRYDNQHYTRVGESSRGDDSWRAWTYHERDWTRYDTVRRPWKPRSYERQDMHRLQRDLQERERRQREQEERYHRLWQARNAKQRDCERRARDRQEAQRREALERRERQRVARQVYAQCLSNGSRQWGHERWVRGRHDQALEEERERHDRYTKAKEHIESEMAWRERHHQYGDSIRSRAHP